MIQTQLLRLDPPYQIISAGGRVGIQVATLIVVEDPSPVAIERRTGRALGYGPMKCNSYPVVNYGLKQGLDEQMKYQNNPLDYEAYWAIRRRMQPEGAVWSGVDVKDVKVLGLAGANNDPVGLEQFIDLIPTVWRTDPILCLWDKNSTSRIYDLFTGLGNVGLKHQKLTADHLNGKNVFPIRLDLEQNPSSDGFYIKVVIIEDTNALPWEMDKNVFFRCVIEPSKPDSISECATTILEGVHGIRDFLPTWNVEFIGRQSVKQGDKIWADAMKQLLSLIKDNYKG